jgi:hypothetical protein
MEMKPWWRVYIDQRGGRDDRYTSPMAVMWLENFYSEGGFNTSFPTRFYPEKHDLPRHRTEIDLWR